jgi:hypothetical protein
MRSGAHAQTAALSDWPLIADKNGNLFATVTGTGADGAATGAVIKISGSGF